MGQEAPNRRCCGGLTLPKATDTMRACSAKAGPSFFRCDFVKRFTKSQRMPQLLPFWVLMPDYVLPILLFGLTAGFLSFAMWGIASLLGPRRASAVKRMPYESGMDPIHDTRRRFDVRFYLVAIAFLIFDVELLFLYPWAVSQRHFQGDPATLHLIFAEVMLFIGLLAAGFVYAWKKGVFRWR